MTKTTRLQRRVDTDPTLPNAPVRSRTLPYTPARSRTLLRRTNLYEKWLAEAISQQVAQGGLANIQIYTRSGLRTPFPSRWPRTVSPAYTSILEVASGGHFPASGPGRSRQRTNLYEKWPPEAISQQVAQGGPANVQIYTRSGFRKPPPSRWPREQAARGNLIAGPSHSGGRLEDAEEKG